MRKLFIKFIITILFVLSVITVLGLLENNTYASSISSNIDGIDESKYPGIKQLLKDVKSRHPNWKINLYYTGLDWDTVIAAENEGHLKSPVSLIHDTYSIGWICPICGYTKYDVSKRYYCASKEAIEYMMDPRNSLTDEYIFQFQDLSSSVGERSAIERMTQGTFLNKPSYIDAIMEAAQTEGISPFHLVSRIRQEQGSAGIGTMNGYVYQTEDGQSVVVYNLFNINVSGNDSQAGFLAGAKFAYEQGWTTAEASIKGGAKFLKEEYLNVGQTTLYFQKFDVIETGGLYNNQYMQNIRAANDEGNSMYQTYEDNVILNSTFEFTIPLYENMSKEACKRPIDNYYGTINTEFINMNWTLSNGANYLQGEIYIAEWVDGNCWTPSATPKMTLKSTDGKAQYDMYVSHLDGIRYYFDRDIEKIDTSKEYYIEVELQGSRNMASAEEKTQKVILPDKVIKEGFKNKTIKIVDNKIVFSDGEYKGTINTELKSTKLIQNSNGEYYISGYVDIGEYIDGKCNTPKSMPEIWLKSTDGSFEQIVYVGYEGGLEYYFDKMIQYLDMSKEYYLEAVLTTEDNKASLSEKSQKLKLGNSTVGEFDNITVVAKNNNFVMNYMGTINTELESINLIQNGSGDNYISGYIYIAEWINGECKTPFEIPEIRIKSTDGTFETNAYVGHEDGIKYYFDKCITDFDVQKEYIIEAYLVTKNNVSSEEKKTQEVKIPNGTIGKQGTVTVAAKDNKIKIADSSLYKGTINTELYDMNIIQNSEGDNYISGYIYIAEWVGGNCNTPKELPKMTLKSEDGSFETNMYVGYQSGIEYYFDKNIEGLDTSKTYYIEVELQGKNNTASKEEKTQRARITKQGEIGICTNGNKVSVSEDIIVIENIEKVKSKAIETNEENIIVIPEVDKKEELENNNEMVNNVNIDNKDNFAIDNTTSEKDVEKTETKEEQKNSNKEDENKNQNIIENTNNIVNSNSTSNSIEDESMAE